MSFLNRHDNSFFLYSELCVLNADADALALQKGHLVLSGYDGGLHEQSTHVTNTIPFPSLSLI